MKIHFFKLGGVKLKLLIYGVTSAPLTTSLQDGFTAYNGVEIFAGFYLEIG